MIGFVHVDGYDMLVTGSHDGVLHFWSRTLQILHTIDMGEPITCLTSIGPQKLAVGTSQGIVAVNLLANFGDGPPGSHWKLPFRVIVPKTMWKSSVEYGFATLDEAIAGCQAIVDEDLREALMRGRTSPLLSYQISGRCPYITGDRNDTQYFSAWEYAESRLAHLADTSPRPTNAQPGP